MLGYGFDIGSAKPTKSKAGPIPTLQELTRYEPHWLWLYGTNASRCLHKAAMPIAPLIIRWGPNTSSNKLRRCARCTKCGTWGAYTYHPSVGSIPGLMYAPFPVEARAFVCREES